MQGGRLSGCMREMSGRVVRARAYWAGGKKQPALVEEEKAGDERPQPP